MRYLGGIFLVFISQFSFGDCVILLHGLGRTALSMETIEKTLEENSYTVINTSYNTQDKNIAELAEAILPSAVDQCPENSNIHAVTHSLGGILIREYFSNNPHPKLKRIVMLGPPNKGSEVVDALKKSPANAFLENKIILELGTDENSTPNSFKPIESDIGIIAGDRSINWILSAMIPGEDDGKVSVENTKLEEMNDHIILPVTHTFMMQNKQVIEQVIYYLANGKFYKPVNKR